MAPFMHSRACPVEQRPPRSFERGRAGSVQAKTHPWKSSKLYSARNLSSSLCRAFIFVMCVARCAAVVLSLNTTILRGGQHRNRKGRRPNNMASNNMAVIVIDSTWLHVSCDTWPAPAACGLLSALSFSPSFLRTGERGGHLQTRELLATEQDSM